jgi:hypothetical protein
VLEDNVQTFAGNWYGTGTASGSGDSEIITLQDSEYMESELVNTGVYVVSMDQNLYGSGDTAILLYRHGTTEENCLAASWEAYTGPFNSLGYIQVRLEN